MSTKIYRQTKAFTLIELLVCMSIILILAALLFSTMKTMRDRGNIAKCASNLRALSAAAIMYANEHDGYLWTRADLGNSMYRMADDDKSPVKILARYAPPTTWICPGAPKSMAIFKNNYTWTIAAQFDTKPVAMVGNAAATVLFWDAFAYTLPTQRNANESLDADGNGKGPSQAKLKTMYHFSNTKTNYGYLDGHVETR